MKPTIGRIVLFRMTGELTFPAMVTKVPTDDTVDLQIFGTQHDPFVYGVTQGEDIKQWDWMAFQKDQAARLAKENKDEVIGDTPVV